MDNSKTFDCTNFLLLASSPPTAHDLRLWKNECKKVQARLAFRGAVLKSTGMSGADFRQIFTDQAQNWIQVDEAFARRMHAWAASFEPGTPLSSWALNIERSLWSDLQQIREALRYQ